MKIIRTITCLLLSLLPMLGQAAKPENNNVIKQLSLPPGFKISIFAEQIPSARSLALGDNGIVYVGSSEGSVYALQDQDQDGVAEQRYLIAKNLYMPNGVAYHTGSLYVAEVNRIIRFDHITEQLRNPPQPVVVYNQFPSDKHHGWKYLRFGPDNKLYTAVGMACNICKFDDEIFGTLVRLNPDGSGLEILAHGIRNSVGFAWHPDSGQLFFNDHGRDYLGDDAPPEELNLLNQPGAHFGFPYCHAGTIADPEFGKERPCSEFQAPLWTYKAHIAPLGMIFYTGTQFPAKYRHQLLVAQHGSWNRTQPQGYQIALVNFKNGKPYQEQTFIGGWLTANNQVLGRPVDIIQTGKGSLLISDDKLGVIYQVEYLK